MRIILLSYSAEGFAVLHGTCAAAGHDPVAYLHARSMRPRGPNRPEAGSVIDGLVKAIPPGMDLLLPGSTERFAQVVAAYGADLIVSYGFPWRLSRAVLQATDFGAINIHTSMLPRYRGPMPVHWAIRNGDPHIGVTIHWMDEHFDTGNIIVQEGGIPLDDDVVPAQLWRNVEALISRLLPVALDRAFAGFAGRPQAGADSSYAGWLEPRFSCINWQHKARDIHNQVRTLRFASSGSCGPRALVHDAWISVLRTSVEPTAGIEVSCADGPIWIVASSSASPPDETDQSVHPAEIKGQ